MRVRYSFSSRRTGHTENIRKQRKKFPDIVMKILDVSDAIIQVLDVRFIEETRNLELEELIKEKGKKIIYVLNKSDLVEVEKKKEEVRKLKLYPHVFVSCTKRTGASELRTRIKIESKKVELGHDKMRRVQVGIVGYPNTGKSSLINLLTGATVAKVGAEAGFTKGMQKVRLTSDILILDTPGVIPSEDYSHQKQDKISQHAKVGARDASKVRRPDMVVQKFLEEHKKEIESFYKIETKGDGDFLIQEIGKQRNFLKKGGNIDEDRAARSIISDWQSGKIKV